MDLDSRTREQLLAELARDFQAESDLDTTMRRIAYAALDLIDGATSAGISIADKKSLVCSAASTDATAEAGDVLQTELQEGPCIAATWDEPHILAADLATDQRWPRWAARVVEGLGVRSMLCARLYTHHERIGALNLYSARPNAFDQHDVEAMLSLTAHSSVAIARALESKNLKAALDSRTTISQAVGLLMQQHRIPSDTAFALLVRLSSRSNRKVHLIAEEMVTQHDRETSTVQQLSDTIRPERGEPKPRPPKQSCAS